MRESRLRGMAIAVLGISIISFDALLVRLADTDASIVSFYRGLFMGISMMLLWRISPSKDWMPNGRKEAVMFLFITLLAAASSSLFVFSVKYTTAANTVVLLATSAFFAAIFSYFFIKEKIKANTVVAIIVSFIGVFIIFKDSFGSTGSPIGDLLGLLLAIVMGLELTLLRKYPQFPHMLIISLSGFIAAFFMSTVMQGALNLSYETFFWLSVMGFVQMPAAMTLIFLATRYITSAEVSLFSTVETTLAPIWLWIFINEIPPKMTLIGGMFVISAILINSAPKLGKRKNR